MGMTADEANETMLARGHWHHIKMLRERKLPQNSIPKKNTYLKQDKILSQTYNNCKTASPLTDQCNKCFLKALSELEFKMK